MTHTGRCPLKALMDADNAEPRNAPKTGADPRKDRPCAKKSHLKPNCFCFGAKCIYFLEFLPQVLHAKNNWTNYTFHARGYSVTNEGLHFLPVIPGHEMHFLCFYTN